MSAGYNDSNFPSEIDVFPLKRDITYAEITDYERYHYLKLKEVLTQSERVELDELYERLKVFLISAVDFNKLGSSMTQIQIAIRDRVTELDLAQEQMEEFIEAFVEQAKKDIQEQQESIDEQQSEIDEWWAIIKSNIVKGIAPFSFDNIARLQGSTRDTKFLDNGDIEEVISITDSKHIVATRETTFNNDGSISTIEKVYDEDGETIQEQANIEVLFAEDGDISEVVK